MKEVDKCPAEINIARAKDRFANKNRQDEFPIVYAGRSGEVTNEIGRNQRKEGPGTNEQDAQRPFQTPLCQGTESGFMSLEIFVYAKSLGTEIEQAGRDENPAKGDEQNAERLRRKYHCTGQNKRRARQ